jgi:hypothetical protein
MKKRGGMNTARAESTQNLYRMICCLVILISVGNYVYEGMVIPLARVNPDFLDFYAAGATFRAGDNFYDAKDCNRHAKSLNIEQTLTPYWYPPFFILFLGALSYVPLAAARLLWHGLAHVFVLLACFWTLRGLKRPDRLPSLALVCLVVGNFSPLHLQNRLGQTDAMVWALMAGSFFCWMKRKNVWAGFWMALAVAIKVFPIVPLLYMIIRRKGKPAVGALIMLAIYIAAVLIFGLWGYNAFYVNKTLEVATTIRDNTFNQGLGAFLYRLPRLWAGSEYAGGTPPWYRPVYFALAGLILLLSIAAEYRKKEDEKGLGWSLAACLCFLLPSVSWEAHRTGLLTAILAALFVSSGIEGLAGRGWQRLGSALLVLGWAGLALNYAYDSPLLARGLPSLLASAKFYATVLVWLGICVLRWKESEPAGSLREVAR